MAATASQQAIINSTARRILVVARAGCGKTYTLREFAKARPGKRGLYIVFNTENAKEAKESFPDEVTTMTSHALAMAAVGRKYQTNPGKLGDSSLTRWSQALNHPDIVLMEHLRRAINGWFASVDEELAEKHLHPAFKSRRNVVLMQQAWDIMKDADNLALAMPHDGYLKEYQLSRPDLSHYDYILYDEGQDANPAGMACVAHQDTQVVLVGDPEQAIYQFRGSVNALATFDATERHELSESWRFGGDVSRHANQLLALKGSWPPVKGYGPADRVGVVDTRQAYTVLCRGNAEVFRQAIAVLQSGRGLNIMGGIQGLKLDDLRAAVSFQQKEPTAHPLLKSLKNWEGLKRFAEATEDRDWSARIAIVEEFSVSALDWIEKLEALPAHSTDMNAITISTAHKSKGLEWDQVRLADDFRSLIDMKSRLPKDGVWQADLNLLYVAVTRAKTTLELNKTMREVGAYIRELKAA